MMKILQSATVCLGLIFWVTSCNNPDLTPSYVAVAKENVTLDPGQTDGTSEHDFSDVWVYVNSEKLGSWELPCKVPALTSDVSDIMIYPGVMLNGVSTMRPIYPFAEPYKIRVNLEKEKISDIRPTFRYYSSVRFPLKEDFENAGLVFEDSEESHGTLQKTSDPNLIYRNPNNPSFVNYHSGVVSLTDTATYFEIRSLPVQLPGNGNYVFFELNYKCDHDLDVGLLVTRSSGAIVHEPLLTIRKSDKWKKMYVNLTFSISSALNYGAQEYRIVLSGHRDKGGAPASFYFDNMQALYLITQ